MTPSKIVKFLDQHVIGQEEAKRQLAVAVYTHY
jgi:ATP-dependent protease Clp ATPase subunit